MADTVEEMRRTAAKLAPFEAELRREIYYSSNNNPEALHHVANVMANAQADAELERLEAWAASLPRLTRPDPGAPRPLSSAEARHRAEVVAAKRQRTCGVCQGCRYGGPCRHYG